MEEKKLTDEEMINRLELYARDGIWWDGIVEMHDILDLIYRLQDEKQKVVQDYYCEAQHCDVQKDIIAKQKAEIEKLKSELRKECEEHEAFTKKAKAEIERLTEERDVYLDDCSAVRHKLRQEIEEKFELQKQVDELKGKLYKSKQDMLVYHSNQMQQTVKDTAKEILLPLIDCEKQIDPLKTGIRWSVLKGFCKKFSVEVE